MGSTSRATGSTNGYCCGEECQKGPKHSCDRCKKPHKLPREQTERLEHLTFKAQAAGQNVVAPVVDRDLLDAAAEHRSRGDAGAGRRG